MKTVIDLEDDLPEELSKMALRAIRRLVTHPSIPEEKRIELLRVVTRASNSYLKIARLMPERMELNEREWTNFVGLCNALGFDPPGLKNRPE